MLFEAAIKFLIIPATSIPSERVFSVSGEVLRKDRRSVHMRQEGRVKLTPADPWAPQCETVPSG